MLPPSVVIEKQLLAGWIQTIARLFVAALAKLFSLPAGKRLKSQTGCRSFNYSLFDFCHSAIHEFFSSITQLSSSTSSFHSFTHKCPHSAF